MSMLVVEKIIFNVTQNWENCRSVYFTNGLKIMKNKMKSLIFVHKKKLFFNFRAQIPENDDTFIVRFRWGFRNKKLLLVLQLRSLQLKLSTLLLRKALPENFMIWLTSSFRNKWTFRFVFQVLSKLLKVWKMILSTFEFIRIFATIQSSNQLTRSELHQ